MAGTCRLFIKYHYLAGQKSVNLTLLRNAKEEQTHRIAADTADLMQGDDSEKSLSPAEKFEFRVMGCESFASDDPRLKEK
jgi:hypothetical protein